MANVFEYVDASIDICDNNHLKEKLSNSYMLRDSVLERSQVENSNKEWSVNWNIL